MKPIGSFQRRASRCAFLVAGLVVSAWAPLVPYVKQRLDLNEAALGLLLLCLGAGSLMAMPFTGILSLRFGCRRVILVAGAVLCLVLPALAAAAQPWQLGLALALFGAAIGTFDVAVNVQAVTIEKACGGALMSGFHALFSVGGFAGSGSMALLLWLGLNPVWACLVIVAVLAALLLGASPYLLPDAEASASAPSPPLFVMPHGAVILIGLMCCIVFLAEGAMLDWSALMLTAGRGLDAAKGGLGYASFALAMTLGRFSGDRIVRRVGRPRVLLVGGLCAATGFFVAVLAGSVPMTLFGFVLVGLGCANIVPILFTAAGSQHAMPASLAIAAVTTMGFAGLLAGPAVIGFVASASSLGTAFTALGCALVLVVACARAAKVAH